MPIERLSMLSFVVALVGCEVTTTLGQLGDEAGDTPASESGRESASESSAGESGGESSGSESSGAPTSSDGESGFDTMGDPSFGEGGPDMCMTEPGADVCMVCLAELCCFEWMECVGEPSCACMLDCQQNLPPPECGMICMPDFHYFALLQCRDSACAGVC